MISFHFGVCVKLHCEGQWALFALSKPKPAALHCMIILLILVSAISGRLSVFVIHQLFLLCTIISTLSYISA